MNRISRLFVASCAGVALTFTSSPALAAHTDDGGKGAHVDRYASPDGTTEYHAVTRHLGDDHYITNSRDRQTIGEFSSDNKSQYTVLENVTKLTSQATYTECRTNSLYIEANGKTRKVTDPAC